MAYSINIFGQSVLGDDLTDGTQVWTLFKWPFTATVVELASGGGVWATLGSPYETVYKVEIGVTASTQTAADLLAAQSKTLSANNLYFGPTFYGQALIDFGASLHGESSAEVVIADPGVTANSNIKAYFMAANTVHHNPPEHRILDLYSAKCAGSIVPGVGFTLYCDAVLRVRGTFQINYSRD
jgi:hypothetical protein